MNSNFKNTQRSINSEEKALIQQKIDKIKNSQKDLKSFMFAIYALLILTFIIFMFFDIEKKWQIMSFCIALEALFCFKFYNDFKNIVYQDLINADIFQKAINQNVVNEIEIKPLKIVKIYDENFGKNRYLTFFQIADNQTILLEDWIPYDIENFTNHLIYTQIQFENINIYDLLENKGETIEFQTVTINTSNLISKLATFPQKDLIFEGNIEDILKI